MLIKDHNVETGEVIEREMTADELAQIKKDEAEIQAQIENQKAKAAAKSVLLTKLGITEDEARLLLS